MADNSSSSSDESLDVTSEKFDPMKALYSSKVHILSLKAAVYDNLSKYESIVKGLPGVLSKKTEKSAQQQKAEEGECSKRRFLPHQEPVPSTRSGREGNSGQERYNVLTKMQRALGPLGMLYRCMESKARVKVYTRSARGIRGHVEAYVAAFDKHWNLALEDCFEVWTRKVKRKAPALGPVVDVKSTDENYRPCKVLLKKSNGKVETLERHVPQMLLRGEQIVIIVKID